MSQTPIPKYRPYLTLPQMERIISLLSHSELDNSIRVGLQSVMLKASLSINKPAYTPTKPSISQAIGLEQEPTTKLEILWLTYVATPHLLSAEQVAEARDYGYASNLMNPAQSAEYEAEQMAFISQSKSIMG